MKSPLLLIVLLILLAGCDDNGCDDIACWPTQSDFSAKLCGDYYIHRSSAHQISVSPISWFGDTPIIPAKIVELGHDDRFIIAKQNHLKLRGSKHSYMEPNPGLYSYWILDVSVPKAYGPLTEVEFEKKRKELDIPKKLVMKDINSYRK